MNNLSISGSNIITTDLSNSESNTISDSNNVMESNAESNITTSESYITTSESSDEDVEHESNLDLNHNIISEYNVIYEIGRGGNSIIWLAYNINNKKFYALKVQNPESINEGISEINFVKKLPFDPNVFNNIITSFIEIRNNNKYLISVWDLHCSNIDNLLRKGDLILSIDNIKYIMKQLIIAVEILHKKFNICHCDIKTDNILIKGINDKDQFVISEYIKNNFNEQYINEKKQFLINKTKIKTNDKMKIRIDIHRKIMDKIINNDDYNKYSSNSINQKYLKKIEISLADFGLYCEKNEYYDESFGTRYYQAPEIILMDKCSYPIDIWAIGCTFYELLTNSFLFNPGKDSKYSRDYYHLCLINDICGEFPSRFLKKTKHYKTFFNSNCTIKNNNRTITPITIERDDISSNDKTKILQILTQMLEIDPTKRLTIKNLLNNTFFI